MMEAKLRVGDHLRRVRRLGDLSQRDLAVELGVSQPTIVRWENGDGAPSIAQLEQAMNLVGLSLVVVDGDDQPVQPMRDDAARDRAGRHHPAHLDVLPMDNHLGFRSDRPNLPIVVPRRARRDTDREQHREKCGSKGGPADHPTRADLTARRQARLEERRARTREKEQALRRWREAHGLGEEGAAVPEPCACPLDCEERGPCPEECPCQCEPLIRTGDW